MLRYGFFDSEITGYDEEGMPIFDRAESSDFLAMFISRIITNGVLAVPGDSFQVVADEGMRLKVRPGFGIIKGRFAMDTQDYEITIPKAPTAYRRFDRVILRANYLKRTCEIIVREGTPDTSPALPELLQPKSGDYYELCLATVAVNSNQTVITQSNITDTRYDSRECGVVTQAIDHLDTSVFFAQLNQFYAEFVARSDGSYDKFVEDMGAYLEALSQSGDSRVDEIVNDLTEFETLTEEQVLDWFETVKGILNEDEAARFAQDISVLQGQVETLEENFSDADTRLETLEQNMAVIEGEGNPNKVWGTDAEGNPKWKGKDEVIVTDIPRTWTKGGYVKLCNIKIKSSGKICILLSSNKLGRFFVRLGFKSSGFNIFTTAYEYDFIQTTTIASSYPEYSGFVLKLEDDSFDIYIYRSTQDICSVIDVFADKYSRESIELEFSTELGDIVSSLNTVDYVFLGTSSFGHTVFETYKDGVWDIQEHETALSGLVYSYRDIPPKPRTITSSGWWKIARSINGKTSNEYSVYTPFVITIRRLFGNNKTEFHVVECREAYSKCQLLELDSYCGDHLVTDLRVTYDNIASYIEIYYANEKSNPFEILISNRIQQKSNRWATMVPEKSDLEVEVARIKLNSTCTPVTTAPSVVFTDDEKKNVLENIGGVSKNLISSAVGYIGPMASTSGSDGWWKIAKIKASGSNLIGSCEVSVYRGYNTAKPEIHIFRLISLFDKQEFVNVFDRYNHRVFDEIRLTRSIDDGLYFIEVHNKIHSNNPTYIVVSNQYNSYWTAMVPEKSIIETSVIEMSLPNRSSPVTTSPNQSYTDEEKANARANIGAHAVRYGTAAPDNSVGVDGDVYIQIT